ncbi:hypothetical protein B0T13DRAFT_456893 [Neurospora crassa]|nr:hypothetical protein B0T13DRAFT_456893 [Neurospora crassa]
MTEVFWHLVAPDQPIVSLTLPPKLFYVRHRHSQAYATNDRGFISRAPDRDISTKSELKSNAEMHLKWDNWNWESCFISVFGDKAHALRWAGKRLLPVEVYELDTQKLPQGTLVLNLFMLCTFFDIKYKYNENKDEFLFYRGIPGSCVVRSLDSREHYRELLYPSNEFKSDWFDVISVAQRAQTISKAQSTDSCSDVETGHQGHGVEGESRKPLKSASQVRREWQKKQEELERQKSAESSIKTNHDLDVNDLAGQMEVLGLETTLVKHESPTDSTLKTTPESATAAPTPAPNDCASGTATPPRITPKVR